MFVKGAKMKKVLLFIALVLSVACSEYSITGGPGKINPKKFDSEIEDLASFTALNSLALMPVVVTPEIALQLGEGKGFLYEELEKQLRAESTFEVNGCTRECVMASEMGSFPRSEWLRSVRNADAMLVLRVHSYQDRRGSAVGADRGAKLGFSAELINKAGQEVWRGSYYYQDEALSENLLRISKTGWHDVQKLYQDGIKAVAEDLAAKKMAAVSSNS